MKRTVVTIVALAVATLGTVAPARADVGTCKVTNPRTGLDYIGSGSNLQAAIDAAALGTNLRVRGLCVGTFTIGKKLTLSGRASVGYPTPTLDARFAGTVLTVSAGIVTLTNLTITDGATAGNGGGILNQGTLTLDAASSVQGNDAVHLGGGIDNAGSLTVMGGSSVSGNKASLGGGIYNAGGTVVLRRSSLSGNRANNGGGVDNVAGVLTLMGPATVSGNNANLAGGGVYEDGASTFNVCTTWSGAISPNAPNDPPTPTPIAC